MMRICIFFSLRTYNFIRRGPCSIHARKSSTNRLKFSRFFSSLSLSLDQENSTLAGLKSSLRSTSSFLDSRHDSVSPGMSTQLHTCINCMNYCHLADKRKTTQLYPFVCLVHFECSLMSRFLALLAFCFGARWDRLSRNRNLRTP